MPVNLNAFLLTQELMVWDGWRFVLRLAAEKDPEVLVASPTMEGFISDGADLYQECLGLLHDELPSSGERGKRVAAWLNASKKSRKMLAKGTPKGFMSKKTPPEISEDEKHLLNFKHPELSYSDASNDALIAAGFPPSSLAEEEDVPVTASLGSDAIGENPMAGIVNINTASYEELRDARLTVTQATTVLAYRERLGGYGSVDDLDRVPGFPADFLAWFKQISTV